MSRWYAFKLSEPRCPRSYNQSQMSSSYGVSPLVRWNTRGLVNLTLLETLVVFDLTVYIVVHPSPGTKVEVVRQNEETNGFLHNPASLSVVGNRHSIDLNWILTYLNFKTLSSQERVLASLSPFLLLQRARSSIVSRTLPQTRPVVFIISVRECWN